MDAINTGQGASTPPPATADVLIGVEAGAAFLTMTRAATQHLVDKGVLPHFRIGRRICFRRSTLNAWLERLEAEAR